MATVLERSELAGHMYDIKFPPNELHSAVTTKLKSSVVPMEMSILPYIKVHAFTRSHPSLQSFSSVHPRRSFYYSIRHLSRPLSVEIVPSSVVLSCQICDPLKLQSSCEFTRAVQRPGPRLYDTVARVW